MLILVILSFWPFDADHSIPQCKFLSSEPVLFSVFLCLGHLQREYYLNHDFPCRVQIYSNKMVMMKGRTLLRDLSLIRYTPFKSNFIFFICSVQKRRTKKSCIFSLSQRVAFEKFVLQQLCNSCLRHGNTPVGHITIFKKFQNGQIQLSFVVVGPTLGSQINVHGPLPSPFSQIAMLCESRPKIINFPTIATEDHRQAGNNSNTNGANFIFVSYKFI